MSLVGRGGALLLFRGGASAKYGEWKDSGTEGWERAPASHLRARGVPPSR